MAEQENDQELKDALYELLKIYGETEPIQHPEDASTDNQLKCLAFPIEEYIASKPQGTVIDIGFGKGILLNRLSSLPAFSDNRKWVYVGVDFPALHKELMNLAFSLGLHRRTEAISIDTFYSSWLKNVDAPSPFLIVVRNVLHELDIEKTAELFHTLHCKLTFDDVLLIQDLLVFPHVERDNVCWDVSYLNELITILGFEAIMLPEPSKSGAQWFTSKLKYCHELEHLTLEKVRNKVIQGRMKQLDHWRAIKKFSLQHHDRRLPGLAMIDFDLQRVALFEQLIDVGALGPSQRDETTTASVADAFNLAISKYDPESLTTSTTKLLSVPNFRDRAISQDDLETFLTSKDQVVVIRGGDSCGKSVLVAHVLNRRAHSRKPVLLDCVNVQSVWPLLEQYEL